MKNKGNPDALNRLHAQWQPLTDYLKENKEMAEETTEVKKTPYVPPATAVAKSAPAGSDVGQAHAQAVVDEEEDKGYHGSVPDDGADDNAYTVQGVSSGMPTPETTKTEEDGGA